MFQETIWKYNIEVNMKGYTVIIPSVAVGNVGQLACDLLISSLNMKRISSVCSPALIPVLGYDPYDLFSNNLSSSCEVYICAAKKIVVMQVRAPLVYKYARLFLETLISAFKDCGIKDVIILTSSFAHEKKYIETSPFRYLASESSPYKGKLQSRNWLEHELIDGGVKIFGGGFASLLFEVCKDISIPCLILYKYCSEGDNIPDAFDMVTSLTDVVPLFNDKKDLLDQLVKPVSWKLLFGRPPPSDIY